MVANIKKNASEVKPSQTVNDGTNLDQKEMYKAWMPFITKAGETSHNAMVDYRQAGARAVYYAARWGDCSLLNKLWGAFHPSMKLSLRTGFIVNVNDTYKADGVKTTNEAGEEVWSKRPTPLFKFSSTPKNKDGQPTTDFFSFTKPGDDALIKSVLTQMKDAIIEDGITGLESLEWTTEKQAKTLGSAFDDKAFKSRLSKLLLQAAKSKAITMGKTELMAMARVSGIESLDKEVQAAYEVVHSPVVSNNDDKAEIIKPNVTENVAEAA